MKKIDKFYSKAGFFQVGSMVKFKLCHIEKIGKVVEIQEIDNNYYVYLYCTDNTGGYTSAYDVSFITEVLEDDVEDIKKPVRYNKKGKLECWDVIIDQEMNFLEGSVLKYLWRYKEKNGIHDLEKAKVYIDKIIEGIKNNENS